MTTRYEPLPPDQHQWCLSHRRIATHQLVREGCERPDLNPPEPCCDPSLPGIMLPCRCIPMSLPKLTVLEGDCLAQLRTLPNESVHCCVTSPPYWGLRDYGVAGQIGLEKTPEEYVAKMVAVFREVRRVLRDGTLWLNLGDSYWGVGNYRGLNSENTLSSKQASNRGATGICQELGAVGKSTSWNLKPKDLAGIPWRVAFALQADGWWLRQDIIWHKPNPMPESVTDRCTKAHEYIFLLSKNATYFYDAEAVKEPSETEPHAPGWKAETLTARQAGPMSRSKANGEQCGSFSEDRAYKPWGSTMRNKRSVWTVPSQPYPESHFATFPEDLIKPCILAGTSARGCCPKCGAVWGRLVQETPAQSKLCPKLNGDRNDSGRTQFVGAESKTLGWQPTCDCGETQTVPCTVLDPFAGSFTTSQVALELGRSAIGIELNPAYIKLGQTRTTVTPGLPLS